MRRSALHGRFLGDLADGQRNFIVNRNQVSKVSEKRAQSWHFHNKDIKSKDTGDWVGEVPRKFFLHTSKKKKAHLNQSQRMFFC